jgi:hypothetical protein
MKLEVGKYYRTRDGRKVGPMGRWMSNKFDCEPEYEGEFWQEDGTNGNGTTTQDEELDLISEWTDEPAQGPTLSSTSIDQIAIDSLKWHFAQGFDSDLEKEAFRIVLLHYGVRV